MSEEGVCSECGQPARTQVMIPLSLGGDFAGIVPVGKLCRECQKKLATDVAHYARDDVPAFSQIDTGQKLPPEALAQPGTCEPCGRTGPVARSVLEAPKLGRGRPKPVCAECLADIAAGVQKMGGGNKIFVEVRPGRFQVVGLQDDRPAP